MKMASRSIDLFSEKTNCKCSTLFFSNQQKNKSARACSTLFGFLWRSFAQLQRCFVGLNRQTSQLHIILYKGIIVCVYPIFCLLCSCSLLFFTAPYFHLAGRQHFSLSHRRFEFSCFSSYKIRLFCFQSLALALSLLST